MRHVRMKYYRIFMWVAGLFVFEAAPAMECEPVPVIGSTTGSASTFESTLDSLSGSYSGVEPEPDSSVHFRFSGQLSGWSSFTPDISSKFWLGGRYIPQMNYRYLLENNKLLDAEVSANVYGDIGVRSFDRMTAEGKIKPYRVWLRYSTAKSEFRIGLQKINFGSARLFRPLMWFDGMDPRDPLQMTDGVWGGLFRYYFLNNANIWVWSLVGNEKQKGWELFETIGKFRPEAGGRVQLPFLSGETAFSYHFRRVSRDLSRVDPLKGADGLLLEKHTPEVAPEKMFEHRLGFDIRADVVVGLWLETSLTHYTKNAGAFSNQQIITIGTDYTFDIGNGLGLTAEHMVYGVGDRLLRYEEHLNFTGMSFSYPVTMLDNINVMLYYDWNYHLYSFANWHRQLDHVSFYVMGFWNPDTYHIPGQGEFSRYSGKGIQIMFVWNH